MCKSIRLGIIGTGRIAKRFATDAWQELDVRIVAVYNPHKASAEQFCAECQVGKPYDKWDSFIDQIDAAYIATPNETHYAYILKLLQAEKHVLCEKPMVMEREQAEKAFALAKEKHCVLMEAIKTAYCPGFQKVLELIEAGTIGVVRDVEACFTKLVPPDSREWTNLEDGGSMTELGTYGCYVVTKILGCCPSDIHFASIRNEDGVDSFTKVFFEYDDEAMGIVKSGIGVKSEGELIVSGSKGYILVRAPWWLTQRVEVHFENPQKTEVYEYEFAGNGLQYELDIFVKCVKKIAVEAYVTQEQSVAIAGVMERFLEGERKYRESKGNV